MSATGDPKQFDPRRLERYFRKWHEKARPSIKTKPFEQSWYDFLQGWPLVKFPKGQGLLDEACRAATASEPPGWAGRFEQPELRLLASLCREIQRLNPGRPFFLSCRDAGRLVGVSKEKAGQWLKLLELERRIVLVKKGRR